MQHVRFSGAWRSKWIVTLLNLWTCSYCFRLVPCVVYPTIPMIRLWLVQHHIQKFLSNFFTDLRIESPPKLLHIWDISVWIVLNSLYSFMCIYPEYIVWFSCGPKAHVFQAHDTLNRASIGRGFWDPNCCITLGAYLYLSVQVALIGVLCTFCCQNVKSNLWTLDGSIEVPFLPKLVDAHPHSWNLLKHRIRLGVPRKIC